MNLSSGRRVIAWRMLNGATHVEIEGGENMTHAEWDEFCERRKDHPVPFEPANALLLVADSPANLRGCDLGRLFDTYPDYHTAIHQYVLYHRPDLASRLDRELANTCA